MGPPVIAAYDFTQRFKREYKKAPIDVQDATDTVLKDLLKNPNSHRCHGLHGYKPTVYVADVFSNHSWQVTFEMNGTTAVWRRLGKHSSIDDQP